MKAVALVGPWTLIKVLLSCVEGEGHNFEDYNSNHESLGHSVTQSVRYIGIELLGQLKNKEVSWSKQEPREDLTTL